MAGACPTSCPANGCTLYTLNGAGTCNAQCVVSGTQQTCVDADGCCPAGCTDYNDTDCPTKNDDCASATDISKGGDSRSACWPPKSRRRARAPPMAPRSSSSSSWTSPRSCTSTCTIRPPRRAAPTSTSRSSCIRIPAPRRPARKRSRATMPMEGAAAARSSLGPESWGPSTRGRSTTSRRGY